MTPPRTAAEIKVRVDTYYRTNPSAIVQTGLTMRATEAVQQAQHLTVGSTLAVHRAVQLTQPGYVIPAFIFDFQLLNEQANYNRLKGAILRTATPRF